MKRLLLLAAVLAVLTGCTTTKYVEVERVRTDTTYITKHERDSIWLHDSTFIKERGDTVLIERWHTKYREKILHDTVYQSKTDSVPVPYPKIEYVEKKLSKAQKGLMALGYLTLMGIVIFAVWKLKRFVP